jgi:hypothetical protein
MEEVQRSIMKDYRDKEIKWYIFAYLFLVIGLFSPESMPSINIDWLSNIDKLLSSSLLAGAICTLAFVLDCLYTANAKERLLFLGFTALPGKTIFTRISEGKVKDIRFKNEDAQARYSEIINSLPSDKMEKGLYENAKWYSLSRAHEGDQRVNTAHRDYLLARDLYTTTITLLVLTVISMAIGLAGFSWILIGYLFAMLVLTNVVAHFRAHRFVNSVIATDMNPKMSGAETTTIKQ